MVTVGALIVITCRSSRSRWTQSFAQSWSSWIDLIIVAIIQGPAAHRMSSLDINFGDSLDEPASEKKGSSKKIQIVIFYICGSLVERPQWGALRRGALLGGYQITLIITTAQATRAKQALISITRSIMISSGYGDFGVPVGLTHHGEEQHNGRPCTSGQS